MSFAVGLRSSGWLCLVLVTLGPLPPAAGQTAGVDVDAVESCVAQHEQSRLLRVDKRLLEARDAATRCAQPSCPAAIRADCAAWLAEIQQSLPTLVLLAESVRGEETEVRVLIDGVPVRERLDGSPVELAPGTHRLRFEHPAYPPVEQVIEATEGEKNRVLRIRFAGALSSPPASSGTAQGAPAPARETQRVPEPAGAGTSTERAPSPPIPLSTYVLGASSLGALVMAGILYGVALSQRSAAVSECAPLCPESRTDPIRRNLLLGDIAAGSGIVLGAIATYCYARSRHVARPTAGVQARLGTSALSVMWEGRF